MKDMCTRACGIFIYKAAMLRKCQRQIDNTFLSLFPIDKKSDRTTENWFRKTKIKQFTECHGLKHMKETQQTLRLVNTTARTFIQFHLNCSLLVEELQWLVVCRFVQKEVCHKYKVLEVLMLKIQAIMYTDFAAISSKEQSQLNYKVKSAGGEHQIVYIG